ncbi:MAG TPA: 16S rRNA (adenine(1518)-N(6)/adenine(1519)-N(6))-dimethyltransferase RsmA, partial [Actinomycetota bacterium]|nr:16S rRNA (adenine(1518)-N(6)/adenine(1519)-N(6))-dimethyltransferase RsmA [Actinomycetota bacterium]
HFLADPNLARAIVRDAGVEADDRVLEVGAGLGSLTLALADAGAQVTALELDRGLLAGLAEVTDGLGVRILREDAMTAAWGELLGPGRWRMASNLPYNVAVPVIIRMLEEALNVDPFLVMVQREVGERLTARPGEPGYGAVSLKVAYRAISAIVRRIPKEVFWPEPKIESVLVRLERRPPPVAVREEALFELVDEGFAQRRKTMANALVRLGHSRDRAQVALREAGIDTRARAETLDLEGFARLVEALGA